MKLATDTGLGCVNDPSILLTEENSMISALWFWSTNKLNTFADKDDVVGITRKINGGTNGIDHRKNLLIKYKVLQCQK
jgi:putative chitinase